MREPLLAGAWGISGSRDSPQTSTAQIAGAETKLHWFKQCGVYFCSLPHITTWPNLSGTYRLVAILYFFSMFSIGSYMARSFIIDDFHWMLNVFHCKHFLAFLHIFGNLIPISAILPSPPKRHHLFIQNIFISCLLESWNCARPWGFKRKHDRYSWRGLVSLLLKIFNSSMDFAHYSKSVLSLMCYAQQS